MSPPRPAPARSAQARAAQAPPARPDRSEVALRGLLEPVVTATGFELDALDVRVAGRRHTIRLVVDSDSGVGLDDIARLSRAASDELDRNEHLVGAMSDERAPPHRSALTAAATSPSRSNSWGSRARMSSAK